MPDAPLREIVHCGLTLTQFAELSALSRVASPSFQDALDARGLDEEGWDAARAAWNRAIEADLDRSDEGLVVAFADALAEAKERLRRDPPERPDSDSMAPPASAPEPEPIELAPLQSAPLNPAFVPPAALMPAIASAPPTRQRLDVTAKLPLQAIISRILPFQPPPAASVASVGPSAAPAASASPPVVPGSAESPAASASAPPAPAEPLKLQPVSPSLGGTAELVIPRVLPKPLPFAPRDSTPEPAAAAKPAAGSTPRLSPEQYASLTAELAARPDRSAEVRARYFVAKEPAWSALQSEWQQRMTADPRLRQRIAELVAHYRTWFERAGGGPSDR
jgi:hypothetical protein